MRIAGHGLDAEDAIAASEREQHGEAPHPLEYRTLDQPLEKSPVSKVSSHIRSNLYDVNVVS